MDNIDFSDIASPTPTDTILTVDQARNGHFIPPHIQLLLYSDSDWEVFVQEWAHFALKKSYAQVQRFSGAGDRGIDIAGFADDQKLLGIWDNFQCKHYNHPLAPSDVWVELGKMLWYSFEKKFVPPRKYYFVSPKGIGTKLSSYLANANILRERLIEAWDKSCKAEITESELIELTGEFRAYVDTFDFSRFGSKTALELVEEHNACPYHTARFGGGLPPRPAPDLPPDAIGSQESRYVGQLFAAYTDHAKSQLADFASLSAHPRLRDHFTRQRVAFYHAESLRVFARDSVPQGTFEALQDDIYTGVINENDADHPDGYARVRAVTKAARDMQITANALIERARPIDRDGICHQLANDDPPRLQWTKP